MPCVCVLVPYRDEPRQNRRAHLEHFLKTVPGILDAGALRAGTGMTWKLLVAVQSQDGHKFSRGKVLNAAFVLAKAVCSAEELDRVVLHDVDLIPDEERASTYFAPWPSADTHMLALNRTGEYGGCKDYVGGVCAIRPSAFEAADGFPLAFEGWGGEDDALRDRIGTDHIAELSQGHMLNLETDVPELILPGQVRAKDVPEFCMDKLDRRELRRRWKCKDPRVFGLAKQFFAAQKVVLPGVVSENIVAYGLQVNVDHPLSWLLRVSQTRHLPYYVHKRTGATVWDLPTTNESPPV